MIKPYFSVRKPSILFVNMPIMNKALKENIKKTDKMIHIFKINIFLEFYFFTL